MMKKSIEFLKLHIKKNIYFNYKESTFGFLV